MRPVPVHLPDEVLEPVCSDFGMRPPKELNPAERATAQLIARARQHPNPRGRRFVRSLPSSGSQAAFGFDEHCVDIKRRAANDLDEE